MSDKVIVVVSDRDDAKHGEVTVVDNPRTAAHLVETLLEAGFDQGRIHLFSGNKTEMQVSSRPVVALVDDSPAGGAIEAEEAAARVDAEEATPFVKNGVRFSSLFRASQ